MKPLYERDMKLWAEKTLYISGNSPSWYPIKLNIDGNWMRAKIKIRGDIARHWKKPRKSYRIRLSAGEWRGLKEFDLIIAEDKDYELEGVAYEWGKQLGIPVPDYQFVDLQINQKKYLMYLLIERWEEPSFVRRWNSRGSIIKENNGWLNTKVMGGKSLYKNVHRENIFYNPLSLEPAIYKASDHSVLSQKAMTKFAEMLVSLKNNVKTPEKISWGSFLDEEIFSKWAALIIYLGSLHPTYGDNLRWAYIEKKNIFVPLLYDVLAFPRKTKSGTCYMEVQSNVWLHLWLKVPKHKQQVQHWINFIQQNENMDLEKTWTKIEKKFYLTPTDKDQLENRRYIKSVIHSNIHHTSEPDIKKPCGL